MSTMNHRRAGYPFGTIVDFAADGAGCPIFALSPLAIQTRNIMEDPRCSLVMQMPGWGGLANARVTMFGDVYKLPKELQSAAGDIFQSKMSTAATVEEETHFVSGNAEYFRMDRILDIYFVGGFGTVQWVDPQEFMSSQPDKVVLGGNFNLAFLNEKYNNVKDVLGDGEVDDAAFISVDSLGADVRIRRGGRLQRRAAWVEQAGGELGGRLSGARADDDRSSCIGMMELWWSVRLSLSSSECNHDRR